MAWNQNSDRDRKPESFEDSLHDHWILFLAEGAVLILLGLLAIVVPSIADVNIAIVLGWLFLVSGFVGLTTTYWSRQAPGVMWSLISALLAIAVGVVLIANKSQDLYGGLMGWPFEEIGPIRLILVVFFLAEGCASIMFAFEHRRRFSGRWAWMLASGVVDIILGSIIIFGLPGNSAWTMGLLVGINMVLGGVALIAMGLHGRTQRSDSNAVPLRNA